MPREHITPFISVDGLHKAFGPKQVLRGLSLNVERGETLVVLGGSGSGKSVLLKHINGLLRPDDGRVIVDGADISTLDEAALVPVPCWPIASSTAISQGNRPPPPSPSVDATTLGGDDSGCSRAANTCFATPSSASFSSSNEERATPPAPAPACCSV